ncbi:LysR family transcriptional regulator [Palleronia sp. KMU-117]|uniref:LysR family transcriptional regulator n=1 Tax=Palleronia sp. KMU-117 TaxID=3434108 RepID=UPI003D73B1CC
MDWRAVTFDWNRARAFLVTAEEGSLSAAARALGMSQPTLGRQVAALEAELGVALFERVGKGLELTPGGVELLSHVRSMGEAAQALALGASGRTQAIEGEICLTASEVYAAHLLPPVLGRLRAEHPGIEVEVLASNAMTDLRRREADIAVRNVRPTQNDLVARRLPDDEARLYAAPGYLDRIGRPRTSEELARAEFIGFDRTNVLITHLRDRGLPLERRNFPILSQSQLVQWEMVKAGLGIGIFPTWIGDAEPRVERVDAGVEPITFPVWLVAHREVRTSARVRIVFDMLAEEIRRR